MPALFSSVIVIFSHDTTHQPPPNDGPASCERSPFRLISKKSHKVILCARVARYIFPPLPVHCNLSICRIHENDIQLKIKRENGLDFHPALVYLLLRLWRTRASALPMTNQV
ncbi:hypothetical protein K445DRAFT_192409 [Daldinia sp. EC12]|nr:hypothetical protein F4774DRAFT_136068 [Daldinia eschscholtzii]OTB19282.1 hypothetical protein K445DRAFT_192409 [Daldinia sp. EC12]